jgi:AraC family transcriptional regulator
MIALLPRFEWPSADKAGKVAQEIALPANSIGSSQTLCRAEEEFRQAVAPSVVLGGTPMTRQCPHSLKQGQAVPVPLSLQDAVDQTRPPAVRGTDLRAHVSPPPRVIATIRTAETDCELVQVASGDVVEMDFSLPTHLIVLLPDGMSGGCEWISHEGAGGWPSMPPNTIIFNPARDYLRLRVKTSQASCRALLLTIEPGVIGRLSDGSAGTADVKFVQRIGVDDEGMRRTLLTFLQETESPGWNSRLYVETLLTLLLSQLVRCASNVAAPRTPYRKGGLSNWRLKRALELLETDLRRPPSLAELARQVGLHPSSLCHAFRQSMGLSPHRYLLSHRVNRAKEMMRDESRTLTEIALECGFSDSSHFSVAFKRIAGTSPREYRRLL